MHGRYVVKRCTISIHLIASQTLNIQSYLTSETLLRIKMSVKKKQKTENKKMYTILYLPMYFFFS